MKVQFGGGGGQTSLDLNLGVKDGGEGWSGPL